MCKNLPPFLIILVPCYNEAEALPETMEVLATLLVRLIRRKEASKNSCVCYIDDGSKDGTWRMIEERSNSDASCRGIKFAGNAGHQNALWAGMQCAREWGADCIISLDADLQDNPEVMEEMLRKYREGSDIVYGVRNQRDPDGIFKRNSARLFYWIMRKLSLTLIPDHADYRLVSRPVLEALQGFEEHNLFLRGLFPALGFQSSKVYYARQARKKGESKYPFARMLSFAWTGITSCSAAPLRIAGLMGLLCMFFALLVCGVSLYKYACGYTVQGWTSQMIIILFLGSVQLFCLAVIGEYIARIFTEVRKRPRYIIEQIAGVPRKKDAPRTESGSEHHSASRLKLAARYSGFARQKRPRLSRSAGEIVPRRTWFRR